MKVSSAVRRLCIVIIGFTLVGCVATPQGPVELDTMSLLVPDQKIGIVMDTVPDPALALPGANCLLCIAAAATANAGLKKHIKTLDAADVKELPDGIANLLRGQGVDAIVLEENLVINELPKYKSEIPNSPKKDFSELASKHGISKLIVIDIHLLGAVRPYASYIPTGDALAIVSGSAYLVDLSTNVYEWFLPIYSTRGAEGEWKEPPDFPGLTNAYYQVVEQARDAIFEPLSGSMTAPTEMPSPEE